MESAIFACPAAWKPLLPIDVKIVSGAAAPGRAKLGPGSINTGWPAYGRSDPVPAVAGTGGVWCALSDSGGTSSDLRTLT